MSYDEDRPFAADGDLVVALAKDNPKTLVGMGRPDGKTRWKVTLPTDLEDGPYLSSELVIVATHDYQVLALGRQDGKERFHLKLDALKDFYGKEWRKMRIQIGIPEGDQVLVATYGKGADGEPTGKILCLDLKVGTKRWEQILTRGTDHPPLLLGDRIIAAGGPWLQTFSLDGKPHLKVKFDLDGLPKWKVESEVRSFQLGTELDGRYFFIEEGLVRAIDLNTGRVLWTAKGTSGLTGDGNRVFVIEQGAFTRKLVALDATTGERVWDWGGAVDETPWIHRSHILIRKGTNLVALNVSDGKEVWRTVLPELPEQQPLLIGEDLLAWYRTGSQSTLLALDPATGKTRWTHLVDTKPGFGMFYADAQGILFPGGKSTLVCLR